MVFNYYYGSEADQFNFIRIPKRLITDPLFADLSLSAKLLYGILLDRMSLSMKNKWLDNENRVYIIYQITEIKENLNVAEKTAIKTLKEVDYIFAEDTRVTKRLLSYYEIEKTVYQYHEHNKIHI